MELTSTAPAPTTGHPAANGSPPQPGVNDRLTPEGAGERQPTRDRRETSNAEYAAFAGRVIRALQRRVSDGDIESLADLEALHELSGRLIIQAVHDLRAEPHSHSWAQIARVLGISRQAAQQRFGGDGARRPGGQPGDLR